MREAGQDADLEGHAVDLVPTLSGSGTPLPRTDDQKVVGGTCHVPPTTFGVFGHAHAPDRRPVAGGD